MSSSLLREFGHLQIPLQAIEFATNNFADENLVGQDGFGNIYKGQLLLSGQLVNIFAKRLNPKFGQGDVEFWKEISALSRLKHVNIVSIVGFYYGFDEKIIIYKYMVNRSLDKYLSGSTLTWMQRLHICVGVARALSYMHYDMGHNYCLIHRDIKSSIVLLDENWEAKVSGFGLSIANLATRRHRLVLSNACGTPGYIDPVYVETGTLTQKSDVYSFGVVLFEVLCGRIAVSYNNDKLEIPTSSFKKHYEDGNLDEIIDPNLRKQMDPQSFTIFSDTAYQCLKIQRAHRPYMENVVRRLEKALELQWKLENPASHFCFCFCFPSPGILASYMLNNLFSIY